MYNVMCDVNQDALLLLSMLDLSVEDVGRFRDCYLSKDGTKIIVFTRNGAGNRLSYKEVFEELSKHPNYVKDYDDSFDSTYASIEFTVPDRFKNTCIELSKVSDTSTGAEKMERALKELENSKDPSSISPKVAQFTKSLEALMTGDHKASAYVINPDGSIEEA